MQILGLSFLVIGVLLFINITVLANISKPTLLVYYYLRGSANCSVLLCACNDTNKST